MLGEQLPIATAADDLAEHPHVDGLAAVAHGQRGLVAFDPDQALAVHCAHPIQPIGRLDAAGRGWFVDATPADDREFSPGPWALLDADGPAEGRVDRLTVLAHELGHHLGLGHAAPGIDGAAVDPAPLDVLMQEGIRPGMRLIDGSPEPTGEVEPPLLDVTPRIGEALTISPTIRWSADPNGF